jgi:PEP-CTERM motif-containing protein
MKSNLRPLVGIAAAVTGMLLGGMAPAFGQLAATATISSAPNGGNFDYTIVLTDTGTTNIGTFWFAWTPPGQPFEYDFLPSLPVSASQPANWTGIISAGFPGYSIEYYANSAGSAILPGLTGTFHFTSSDSPADLQGLAFGFFPITESFIYAGFPEVGDAARVVPVFVPEPSSFVLAVLGLVGLVVWRRRKRRAIPQLGA